MDEVAQKKNTAGASRGKYHSTFAIDEQLEAPFKQFVKDLGVKSTSTLMAMFARNPGAALPLLRPFVEQCAEQERLEREEAARLSHAERAARKLATTNLAAVGDDDLEAALARLMAEKRAREQQERA